MQHITKNSFLQFLKQRLCQKYALEVMSIIVQQDATTFSLFMYVNCSVCFEF
jgi:hypothetical protein